MIEPSKGDAGNGESGANDQPLELDSKEEVNDEETDQDSAEVGLRLRTAPEGCPLSVILVFFVMTKAVAEQNNCLWKYTVRARELCWS